MVFTNMLLQKERYKINYTKRAADLIHSPLIMVEVTGFEPATPCSQSTYATNCATPRQQSCKKNCITKSFFYKGKF